MLAQLSIQNFGLIDKLSLEFGNELNILTGETGAGKSIIIDALRYALGDRFSASLVRDAQLPCTVEAVFDLSKKEFRTHPLFTEYLTNDDPNLIIHRAYLPDGKNKIKINGFAITVSQLKEIGNHLIDFHGPHDHQLLFSEDHHLDILDRLTKFDASKEEYRKIYFEYSRLRRKLNELQEMSGSRERELDLLSHQVKELGEVILDEKVYEELRQEQIKINNAEKLYEQANTFVQIFENDDTGVQKNLAQAFSVLRQLTHTDSNTSAWLDELARVQESSEGLLSQIRDYLASLSFEPERANEVNFKCDQYDTILRKYGPSLSDAKKFFAEAKSRYELLSNFEENNADLQNQITAVEKKLKQIAQKITKQRQKTAELLKETIEKELTELGIKHVQFEARVEPVEFHSHGQDKVTFYISPNAGVALKPLAEIVSSGEAARVMLALKKALMKVDPIPVLIFDEIDAQIGGRLGTITGKKLKEISQNRQVLLITHLPQIASFADTHFKISKSVKAGRALTNVEMLNKEERVKELAKMMSGEHESKISVTHAQEMLTKAKN